LSAGKRLQQLNIGEGDSDKSTNKLRSELLKKLISTASSASVVGNAAKMLSSLNKDSAYQGDLTNMFIATEGQFPEVCVSVRKKLYFII
jgi:DNA mismatch repair protein MSH3